MIDLDRIIGGLSRSGAAAGLAGGLAGGTLVGALASKKGRKTAKSAMKLGGMALVGGLAWNAYQNYRRTQPGAASARSDAGARTPATAIGPQAPGTAVALDSLRRWQNATRQDFEAVAAEPATQESRSLLIVRAMIAAAMADGHLDEAERGRLFRQIDRLELTAEEKAVLLDELRHPWSVPALAARCADPETAVEAYAAAVLAIDESRPEAISWLRDLATQLQIPPALVEDIHASVNAEKSFALAQPA